MRGGGAAGRGGGATRWGSWERVGQLGGAAGRGWGN